MKNALLLSALSLCLACSSFAQGTTLAKDEIACGEGALKAEAVNVFPAVVTVLSGGAPDWEVQLAALEHIFGDAVVCAVQAFVKDTGPTVPNTTPLAALRSSATTLESPAARAATYLSKSHRKPTPLTLKENPMHFRNGREAKNGDKVILLPSYGAPVVGIL